MPIIDVELIALDAPKNLKNLTQNLTNSAAIILNSPNGQTWLKLHFLPLNQYAENGGVPEDFKSLFVSLLLKNNLSEDKRSEIAFKLCESFSTITHFPKDHIHILFLPEGSGRMVFGGSFG